VPKSSWERSNIGFFDQELCNSYEGRSSGGFYQVEAWAPIKNESLDLQTLSINIEGLSIRCSMHTKHRLGRS
jgi:hypothetical protein